MGKKTKPQTEEKTEPTFTKAQILGSKKHMGQRDLVMVLLKDNESYTLKQVDSTLQKYLKRKVN